MVLAYDHALLQLSTPLVKNVQQGPSPCGGGRGMPFPPVAESLADEKLSFEFSTHGGCAKEAGVQK